MFRFLANDELTRVTKVEKIETIISCNLAEKKEIKEINLKQDEDTENNYIIEKNNYISSRSVKRAVDNIQLTENTYNVESNISENESNNNQEIINSIQEEQEIKQLQNDSEVEEIEQTDIEESLNEKYENEFEDNQELSVIGKIEIPATNVNMPIFDEISIKGMDIACCIYYANGELNKSGIHLIGGHNYNNGRLFSNNYKLNIGDKIYITSLDGEKVEYTIYNKFVTTNDDINHLKKDSKSSPEICLQSCYTDDGSQVLIIQANIEK